MVKIGGVVQFNPKPVGDQPSEAVPGLVRWIREGDVLNLCVVSRDESSIGSDGRLVEMVTAFPKGSARAIEDGWSWEPVPGDTMPDHVSAVTTDPGAAATTPAVVVAGEGDPTTPPGGGSAIVGGAVPGSGAVSSEGSPTP